MLPSPLPERGLPLAEDGIFPNEKAVPSDNSLEAVITPPGCDVQHIITQQTHPEVLALQFATWKKWMILSVIFLVQTSMNFNTSLYANGQAGIAKEFNVSHQTTVTGAAIFLIAYAFGCELLVDPCSYHTYVHAPLANSCY